MFQDTLQLLREDAYSGVRNGRNLQVQGRMMARYARFYCESPARAWKACQFRQDTLEILSRAGMQREMAWVLRYLGHVWYSPKEVQTIYQRALAIFNEEADENGVVDVLYRLGTVAINAGEYQQAEDDLTESLAVAKSIGRQDIALNCLLELGNLSWALGDLPKAVARIDEARLVNEEVGYVTQEARAGRILARVTLSQGDDDRAERILQDSLKIYQDLGLKGLQAETIGELAQVAAHAEDFSTAKQLALESIARCKKLDYLAGMSLPFTILGHAALIQGDLQEAEQCFHQAVETALDAWYPAQALNALEGMVRLLNACDNPEEGFRLATYIYNHPASWWWTKERLLAQLSAVEANLSPALLSDDQGIREGQPLEEVVGEVFTQSG
jgi:tetratricopeptide (TPR) repeat protein